MNDLSQSLSVDQCDGGFVLVFSFFDCRFREMTGRYKDSFCRRTKCPAKTIDLSTSNRMSPALGLKLNECFGEKIVFL